MDDQCNKKISHCLFFFLNGKNGGKRRSETNYKRDSRSNRVSLIWTCANGSDSLETKHDGLCGVTVDGSGPLERIDMG